jgi:hypothetical protein
MRLSWMRSRFGQTNREQAIHAYINLSDDLSTLV